MKPYIDDKKNNIIRRTFSHLVENEGLVWHRDREDRIVIPLNESNWKIQFDSELPKELHINEEIFIPKNTFHRVIKGSGDLMVEIIETKFEDEELVVYEAIEEGEKKKGKKDACYYKVKSRYKTWPSAYGSGSLVQCRKVGAANWGNKSNESEETEVYEAKKTDFSKEKEQGLHGWFARQGGEGKTKGWVDCNTCRKDPKTGKKKCKSCGRKDGEDRAKYPACRPTPSACGTKGKGEKWGKKTNENFENREKISIFDDINYIKAMLRETFNHEDTVVEPEIKPKESPTITPTEKPIPRRDKPFLPRPNTQPRPKAEN